MGRTANGRIEILIEGDAVLKHVDLKHGDWVKYPLHFARVTFDVVIADCPSWVIAHHLGNDARIIDSKYFDSWNHQSTGRLSLADSKSIPSVFYNLVSLHRHQSTVTTLLFQFKGKYFETQDINRMVNHTSTTSFVCEIVLSRGKPILTDLMGSMHPSTFEDVLIHPS